MELKTETSKTFKIGSQIVNIPAGKTLKMEITPNGEEILTFTADRDYQFTVLVHGETTG